MRIDAADIHHVAMPLSAPFNTASGDTRVIDSILPRMSAEGRTGWGESAPWDSPARPPEHAAGALAGARITIGP